MENVALITDNTSPIGGRRPVISVRGLNFLFEESRGFSLKNISLDIFEGEFVVITGPSGCGKSTLAMAMGGYIPHVIQGELSGDVYIGDKNTKKIDLSDISTGVSICQQDPESQLCTLTVLDEVSFGPENLVLPAEEVLRRVDDSLSAIGSVHLRDRGLIELSGGEKQRVAIASMLAMCPKILILDEPTSSLDPDSANDVLLAIEKLRGDKRMTIVVIEHKVDRLLKLADRLIIMDNGEISLDGRPDEVYGKYEMTMKNKIPRPSEKKQYNHDIETINAKDIRFSYSDKEVLHGITFKAHKGELIGIIGPNGSGKTTFLNCLTGLCRPSSGEALVAGINVIKARTSEIARKVGYVFQNPNHQIFENRTYDEVTFACRNFGFDEDMMDRAATSVMEKYGILSYSACHPLKLSHGEKRRLNLCSVLSYDPDILILDEPFIGQDMANVERMITDILGLRDSGKTILLVSHDMDLVFKHCDRIVLFDSGDVVADGDPVKSAERIKALGMPNFLPGGCRNDDDKV